MLEGIEKLSWDAPLVLHAFADHESFPISNALLVVSVALDAYPDTSQVCYTNGRQVQNCDDIVEEHLKRRWQETGGRADQILPIFARILGYSVCL